ncbi:MAG TPA: putative dsRNA-binding protein, partial [Jatrophihabitantaceae bacterium]|nr:putative dsRNA-binding protein [Jatrophihabitantaceae bacterium]
SILADALEALLGAVFLEHGLDVSGRVVHELFDDLMHEVAESGAGLDWKTSLQELTADRGLGVPEYVMTSRGPDHEKTFTAAASVAGENFPASTGRSKKEAEQAAAETAWRAIAARPAPEPEPSAS